MHRCGNSGSGYVQLELILVRWPIQDLAWHRSYKPTLRAQASGSPSIPCTSVMVHWLWQRGAEVETGSLQDLL
jgi:hypothetical protein